MILVDANLLIYACVAEMPQHQRSRAWLTRELSETPRVGLPWPNLLAFVRLTSNPRVFAQPVPIRQAWGHVETWLALPNVWVPTAGPAGTPLHGANLFPASLPEFRAVVLEYLEALTRVGHTLMRGMALSLGLPADWFHERYTADPLILFRIFHYPPQAHQDELWGVGEHTDYGVLTILLQDDAGWLDAPPVPGSFVCNLGDMLDRMTGGFYRSTPHRVRNVSGRSRLSFPFFFDPNFAARIAPIDPSAVVLEHDRWDGASVHEFTGTYGDYVLGKVAKVFPELGRGVIS